MFSRDRDKNKKSLVYPPPCPENPSSWDPTLIPRTSPSTWRLVLSDSGRKVTNPPKRWQFPRTGGQILSTNIWEMSGSYTRFFTRFFVSLGVLVLLNLYIDCFFLSTTTMRAILYLNRISGGIPNCEVASHAASHGTRNPRLEPLKLISNTCHGTFRTKPWNPPKPFATNSPKLSKNKAKPTFQICHEETSVFPPLEPLYPKPSKLQKFPFYSPQPGSLTTTSPTIPVFQPHPGLDVDHEAQEGTKEFTKHQVGLHRSQGMVGEGNCLALNRLAISGYNIQYYVVCLCVCVCLFSKWPSWLKLCHFQAPSN